MTRILTALFAAAALTAAEPPRLVVVVSVDQLRPDTLARFAKEYTGGLKRLLDHGLRYRGTQDHAATETGPGHSTILTGCRPAKTGIVGNQWVDRKTFQPIYCCGAKDAPVFGVADKHRSPELLLRTGLGDWMKAADKRAKVFSVSCKDRAAILLGGKRPDGAFWLEKTGEGFSTSAYYYPNGAPEWLQAFNNDGWLDKLPEHWTYEPVDWLRADDDPRESPGNSRSSPHPLRGKTRQKTLRRVYASPYGDAFTLRLARELVERNDLGGDEVCDLLAISLSSTDIVGHAYGPLSQEIRDTELRLDRNLGKLFDYLDGRGAPYAVALTSDHGVLPIPDRTVVDARRAHQGMSVAIQKLVGVGDWFRRASSSIYLRPKPGDEVRLRDAIAGYLRKQKWVAAVFGRADLAGKETGELLDLVRHSFHPDRSGDLFVIPTEKTLVTTWATGTSHGSPYRYDREVPIVFWGPGIATGARDRIVATIDIGPTLAGLIGVAAPKDVDGAALPLK